MLVLQCCRIFRGADTLHGIHVHMDAREHRHGTKNNLPSLLGNFMLLVGTNYWQFVNLRRGTEQNWLAII